MEIITNDHFRNELTSLHLCITHANLAKCDSSWVASDAFAHNNVIYMVTSGTAELYCNNVSYQMLPGNIYVMPKNTHYAFCCSEYMEKLYFGLDVLNRYNETLTIAPPGILVLKDRKALIGEMMELYWNDDYQSMVRFNGHLWQLLAWIMEQTDCKPQSQAHSPLIDRALHLIAGDLNMSQNADALAKQLNIAPVTLRTHFKAEIGMPLGKYLRLRILEAAAGDIVSSRLSLKEIGDKYGFYDQFYFSRLFTKHYGISPSKYRKNNIF